MYVCAVKVVMDADFNSLYVCMCVCMCVPEFQLGRLTFSTSMPRHNVLCLYEFLAAHILLCFCRQHKRRESAMSWFDQTFHGRKLARITIGRITNIQFCVACYILPTRAKISCVWLQFTLLIQYTSLTPRQVYSSVFTLLKQKLKCLAEFVHSIHHSVSHAATFCLSVWMIDHLVHPWLPSRHTHTHIHPWHRGII